MKTKSANPRVKKLVDELSKKEEKIWKDTAKRLSKPNRNRPEVNIHRINMFAKDGETILVPGKVLGYGHIDKKVNVAALSFSKDAMNKINSSGGKSMKIEELVGKKCRIRIFG